ncbi:efflux RND transporter permease subunit, partial [bacterium]|nr:efflux RND transporter permease subunit [bacterium]
LDLEKLERYQLTADAVAARLDARDDLLPAGPVRRHGRELAVSVRDTASARTLAGTVLAVRGGQPVTLRHVAEVEPSFEDIAYYSRIDGSNVVTLLVTKRSGQNSISISRRLRAELPKVSAESPFPVEFEVDQDEGADLEEKLRDLVTRSLVILGLLFALLALALRRLRLVAIVIASILLAIVICLSLFYFFGVTVNFITISGLTVCFGMLLDNSILALDAIHRRLSGGRAAGSREALLEGTREVAFPILATTLTTVVAFLSFIFLTDRLSLFYVPLAVSVGIAMLASILVAFAWIPVSLRGPAERELRRSRAGADEFGLAGRALFWRWALGTLLVALGALAVIHLWKDAGTLRRALPWTGGGALLLVAVGAFVAWAGSLTRVSLRVWYVPLALTVALGAGAAWVFKEKVRTGGFWRPAAREQIIVYLEQPTGTDVKLSSETIRLFEQEVLPVPEGAHLRSGAAGNRAWMFIEFDDELLTSAYPELFRNRVIVLAEELGGMFIWINGFGDPYMKGGRGGGLANSTVRLTGYNSKELKAISDGVLARLDRNRRVRNARLTSGDQFSRSDTDETVVVLDRQALAAHRLSMAEVMGHIRRLLGVETPWHMVVDGEDQRLMLTYADADQIQYDQVLGRTLTTSRGQKVQLGRIASLERRPEIGSIERHDQRYSQLLNWEYIGTDRMRRQFIEEIIAGITLPYGYTAEDQSGQQVTQEEEAELRSTLWLTIAFVFMVLAAMFESLLLPLLVMLAVPLSLVGVAGIFWATGAEFDSSARIGLVLMFGVVVNNAILLIERFRLQVRELAAGAAADGDLAEGLFPAGGRTGGFDLWRLPAPLGQDLLRRAICDGVRIQLRSILLTSGTTIAGLLPLLYKHDTGDGRDIWENLALSSIGGLGSSTVLILGAVPALYWAFTRWGWGLARARARWAARRRGSLTPADRALPAAGDG